MIVQWINGLLAFFSLSHNKHNNITYFVYYSIIKLINKMYLVHNTIIIK